MSKSIQNYLPIKSKDNMMIQGRVPTDIVLEAKKIMKQDRLSWSEVLTACLCHFLDEKAAVKKK